MSILVALSCCSYNTKLYQSGYKNEIINDTIKCDKHYLIKGINLIDTTYIIIASRNDSLFKIVSPVKVPLYLPPMLRNPEDPCEEIKEGRCYAFEIHSLFEISKSETSPDSNHGKIASLGIHRGTMRYNGSTISFDKESHYELYYSRQLSGKCISIN